MTIVVDDETKLELISEKHAEALFKLARTNKEQLAVWLPWVDRMQTVEQFRNFTIDAGKRHADGSELPLVIIFKGELAGRLGVYNIDMQNKFGSIGYWLGDKYQGRGIVTKSCRETINYVFSKLGFNRVEIKCGTGNVKSQSIPVKLNFTKEGILRQAEFVNNRFIDLILFSMLKAEWKKTLIYDK